MARFLIRCRADGNDGQTPGASRGNHKRKGEATATSARNLAILEVPLCKSGPFNQAASSGVHYSLGEGCTEVQ